MVNITAAESILLQCLATTSLLGELSNAGFLKSDYFKNLTFANNDFKNILVTSGLGNPATMQMMLYALLVVPKELLEPVDYDKLENSITEINNSICQLVEIGTVSTYYNENSKKTINYFRHIRNAVAHSRCEYLSENKRNYVVFTDENQKTSECCSIKMKCSQVGSILMELQKLILEYYKNNHH